MTFFKGCISGQPSLGHSSTLILCLIQCLESCQRLSGLEQSGVPELLPALLQFTLVWAVLSLWTAVLGLIFYLLWKGNYVITCCYLNSYSSLESLHEQVALCVCAEFVSARCEDDARVDLLFYFGVVWVKCT